MKGCSIPFRLDWISYGGKVPLFVTQNISCKMIKTACNADFEGIFVELNLRKKNGYFSVLTIRIKVKPQTI